MAVAPNTVSNKVFPIGLHSVAGTAEATKTINKEKNEAKIPEVTTKFAFLFPYTSLIMSVIRKVIG